MTRTQLTLRRWESCFKKLLWTWVEEATRVNGLGSGQGSSPGRWGQYSERAKETGQETEGSQKLALQDDLFNPKRVHSCMSYSPANGWATNQWKEKGLESMPGFVRYSPGGLSASRAFWKYFQALSRRSPPQADRAPKAGILQSPLDHSDGVWDAKAAPFAHLKRWSVSTMSSFTYFQAKNPGPHVWANVTSPPLLTFIFLTW
jgi:hypothetical protein